MFNDYNDKKSAQIRVFQASKNSKKAYPTVIFIITSDFYNLFHSEKLVYFINDNFSLKLTNNMYKFNLILIYNIFSGVVLKYLA
ncbi:hypothetical protein CHRYSEO8AT_490087 [Chryseobacterium sp. 8AT]|nr:hypothetical protein CHRYSEO8AT_490087 [Chryseobacterium sp. 8AT]